jgi:hypothetical protein
VKNVSAATNNSILEKLLDGSFSMPSVSYQRGVCVDLCIPLSLLGNGSANMFPRQRGIVEGAVFYAGRVVSMEWRLVFPRTSYYHTVFTFKK